MVISSQWLGVHRSYQAQYNPQLTFLTELRDTSLYFSAPGPTLGRVVCSTVTRPPMWCWGREQQTST